MLEESDQGEFWEEGVVRCLSCQHEWWGKFLWGESQIECPSCEEESGIPIKDIKEE